jgi:hypothetical protein
MPRNLPRHCSVAAIERRWVKTVGVKKKKKKKKKKRVER